MTSDPLGGVWRPVEDNPAYNPPPFIVGLGHRAQVGKDSAAAALVELGYERVAFADTLREMLLALDPFIGTGRRVSDVVSWHGWDAAKTGSAEIRRLLQRLGTEVGRNLIGENVWVDAAFAKMKPGGKYVVTDVRFPNEAQAILDHGGYLYRIDRPGHEGVNAHSSEHALADWGRWHAVLENSYPDTESWQRYIRYYFRTWVEAHDARVG